MIIITNNDLLRDDKKIIRGIGTAVPLIIP